jgi:hypothetical protein
MTSQIKTLLFIDKCVCVCVCVRVRARECACMWHAGMRQVLDIPERNKVCYSINSDMHIVYM